MKNIIRNLAASLAALAIMVASGCAYSHTQRPLSVNFNKTELGTKTGRSSSRSIMWLVAWGDSGTKAAAENGGIKVIECADTEIDFYLFGAYTRVTTIVYGN